MTGFSGNKITCAFLLFACFVACSINAHSQQQPVPLNRFTTSEIERALINDTVSIVHRASKPFLENKLNKSAVYGLAKDSTKVYTDGGDKLYRSHLIEIKGDDYFIGIDPLMDFAFLKELSDTSDYSDTIHLRNNTRGFQVIGDLGKKFSFQTSFYENQSFLPIGQKAFADSSRVIPGFGRWKVHDIDGYDYAMASGLLSYSPREWINIQFGHGKNFFGHGYRSLLLSDAAFNYPHIKTTFHLFNNRLQYTCMFATLQTLERLPLGEVPEALYKRKGASFNYLSWIPFRNLEIGLFEGTIWKKYDEQEGNIPLPWGAYVPVIGLATAVQGWENENNVLVGANIRYDVPEYGFVYAQLAVDDPASDSYGFQLGAKLYDFIFPRLDIQAEWNNLGDYMYANHSRVQSYSHTAQPLGHPTGGATNELLGIVNYRWRRIIGQVKFNQLDHSLGPEGNWKNDPRDVMTNIAPFPEKHIQQWEISAGYLFNPKTNFQVFLGWSDRVEKTNYNWQPDEGLHSSFITISVRTNLINRYWDF